MKKKVASTKKVQSAVVTPKMLDTGIASLAKLITDGQKMRDARLDAHEKRFDTLEEALQHVGLHMVTKDVFEPVAERTVRLEQNSNTTITTMDFLTKKYTELNLEYQSVLLQTRRYQRWFDQLAAKTGVTLDV